MVMLTANLMSLSLSMTVIDHVMNGGATEGGSAKHIISVCVCDYAGLFIFSGGKCEAKPSWEKLHPA